MGSVRLLPAAASELRAAAEASGRLMEVAGGQQEGLHTLPAACAAASSCGAAAGFSWPLHPQAGAAVGPWHVWHAAASNCLSPVPNQCMVHAAGAITTDTTTIWMLKVPMGLPWCRHSTARACGHLSYGVNTGPSARHRRTPEPQKPGLQTCQQLATDPRSINRIPILLSQHCTRLQPSQVQDHDESHSRAQAHT